MPLTRGKRVIQLTHDRSKYVTRGCPDPSSIFADGVCRDDRGGSISLSFGHTGEPSPRPRAATRSERAVHPHNGRQRPRQNHRVASE
jgi:hypothetical protein